MVTGNHAMHESFLNKDDNRPSIFRIPLATHTSLQITQTETQTELPKIIFHFPGSKGQDKYQLKSTTY